mmetsp:Transcript_7232/g.9188  ORF Transcript_7232/g.9188 Transcript_7232/m.9188 type:complete len:235 (-) Transcript_7232:278-982(-)
MMMNLSLRIRQPRHVLLMSFECTSTRIRSGSALHNNNNSNNTTMPVPVHCHPTKQSFHACSTAVYKASLFNSKSTSTISIETKTMPDTILRHSSSESKSKSKHHFMPKKAAVKLTPKARTTLKSLLQNGPNDPNIIGIMLKFQQSNTGQPRMVFNFEFVRRHQIEENDEPVSLEVKDDGVTPHDPQDSWDDGLQKLYVHHNAFMKVLGATLDIDQESLTPILHDREGNLMDPNA